uniref:Uncharacterized protein n=1 Tax=Trieres chinensis TaxID=1514140 RepID=A0A7S2AAL7_TRICV
MPPNPPPSAFGIVAHVQERRREGEEERFRGALGGRAAVVDVVESLEVEGLTVEHGGHPSHENGTDGGVQGAPPRRRSCVRAHDDRR